MTPTSGTFSKRHHRELESGCGEPRRPRPRQRVVLPAPPESAVYRPSLTCRIRPGAAIVGSDLVSPTPTTHQLHEHATNGRPRPSSPKSETRTARRPALDQKHQLQRAENRHPPRPRPVALNLNGEHPARAATRRRSERCGADRYLPITRFRFTTVIVQDSDGATPQIVPNRKPRVIATAGAVCPRFVGESKGREPRVATGLSGPPTRCTESGADHATVDLGAERAHRTAAEPRATHARQIDFLFVVKRPVMV